MNFYLRSSPSPSGPPAKIRQRPFSGRSWEKILEREETTAVSDMVGYEGGYESGGSNFLHSCKCGLLGHHPCNPDPPSGLFRCGKVILHLKPKPHFRPASERLGKPDCHFRRNSRLSVQNIVQILAGDAQARRCFRHRQAERFKTLLPHDPSWMRWSFHAHRSSSP